MSLASWNGSAFVDPGLKTWNGSAFVDPEAWIWDGSQFVKMWPSFVPVSYVGVSDSGAQSAGTSTTAGTAAVTPDMPAGVAVGDRVFILRASTVSQSTVSSWTPVFANDLVSTGVVALGSGTRNVGCVYRDYDGIWTMPTVALGGSGTQRSHSVVAIALRKGAGQTWDTPTFVGPTSDNTDDTSFSVTSSSFTAHTGGLLIGLAALNDTRSFTLGSLTGAGMTLSGAAERADGGTNIGNTVRIGVFTASVDAGGAGAITLTATLSANSQGGASFIEQTAS